MHTKAISVPHDKIIAMNRISFVVFSRQTKLREIAIGRMRTVHRLK